MYVSVRRRNPFRKEANTEEQVESDLSVLFMISITSGLVNPRSWSDRALQFFTGRGTLICRASSSFVKMHVSAAPRPLPLWAGCTHGVLGATQSVPNGDHAQARSQDAFAAGRK